MITSYARKKAWCALVGFSLVGILAWRYGVSDWRQSFPLALFYAMVTIHTYLSVKVFSSIIPRGNVIQGVYDIALAIFYVLWAASLGSPLFFAFSGLLLFIVATAKYAFALEAGGHFSLLKYKILVDLSGVCLIALALGGIVMGHAAAADWMMTGAFFAATLFLFFVRPLYRLD